jgi:porin
MIRDSAHNGGRVLGALAARSGRRYKDRGVRRSLRLPAVILCFSLLASVSRADTNEIADGPLEDVSATDQVLSLPGLTGDWGGRRTWLSDHGLKISADLTNTFQGVMHGGLDEDARYVGSSELILDVDGEKLGLWPGSFARVAAEGRFGRDVLSKAGSFIPVSNDALFPADPDREGESVFAITEMSATQFLAPWIGFAGGLLNTTSGDANKFAGFARSNEYFQNLSFLVSPVSMRLVPNVTLGGALVVIPFEGLASTLTFMNSEESAGSDPFKTNSGWTLVSEWALDHEALDLPIRHVFAFALGFDNDFFKLGEFPRVEIPPGGPPSVKFSTKDESWALWYNGQLTVWTDPDNAERNAGPFVRFGYADDETNPVEWNLAVGVGGVGALDARPRDRFGLGVYHVEPSDNFPLSALGIEEETGVEVFYNVHLLEGLSLTADLQYIDTGLGSGPLVTEPPDNAWIGGLRLRFVL